MADVDDFLASMKRTALDMEYSRQVRELLPGDLFPPDAPVFAHAVSTRSARLAAMAAARQGFDAGRFGGDCPYPFLSSPRESFARRAWMIGFAEGVKVLPRPAPRVLPVVVPVNML